MTLMKNQWGKRCPNCNR